MEWPGGGMGVSPPCGGGKRPIMFRPIINIMLHWISRLFVHKSIDYKTLYAIVQNQFRQAMFPAVPLHRG
jgi:hypothetical protein